MFEKAGEKASSTQVGAVDRRLYFKRVLSGRAHLGLRCCLNLAVLLERGPGGWIVSSHILQGGSPLSPHFPNVCYSLSLC